MDSMLGFKPFRAVLTNEEIEDIGVGIKTGKDGTPVT